MNNLNESEGPKLVFFSSSKVVLDTEFNSPQMLLCLFPTRFRHCAEGVMCVVVVVLVLI